MTVQKIFAIVPAAGNAVRLGLGCSKALLDLGGATVLERSVRLLLSAVPVEKMVVLVRDEDRSRVAELELDQSRVLIRQGGASRQESVKNGLDCLTAAAKPGPADLILIHDAARCFASADLIRRCVQQACSARAVIAAVPVVDTIKQVDPDFTVVQSLRRSELVAVQTPQVFSYELIQRAHREAKDVATDDAALVEAFHPVRVVEGERTNIKITTPEDLAWAQVLLNSLAGNA